MRTAFVFPGQGSHRVGILPAFGSMAAQRLIDAISDGAGRDLRAALDDPATGSRTADAQPAILTASLLALDALRQVGVRPDVVAGHSLGEFTAAVSAGVMTARDVGGVVAARGRAMADACASVPGRMVALLRLAPDAVEVLVDEHDGLVIANDNAPGQVVVAGPPDAVEHLRARARDAGGRTVALETEGAFHSPAMTSAVTPLAAALDRVAAADPVVPLVTGVGAETLTDARGILGALLAGMLAPVRWREVQFALARAGVTDVVEVGPGGVLAGLARRTVPDLRVHQVATPEDADRLAAELDELAQLADAA